MDRLRPQLAESVELIIKENAAVADGGATIGENRNEALADAIGDYVCFVDDDDLVSEDYVARILAAIETCPDVVGLTGHYICGANKPELFVHSIRYKEWLTVDGVHQRMPNHINAIRRDLVMQVKYPPKNHGEDFDFSMSVAPLLKTEVMPEEILYYYIK
ncbi:MAG: glycosyltransferase family A protein [Planctomycetota bacterium]